MYLHDRNKCIFHAVAFERKMWKIAIENKRQISGESDYQKQLFAYKLVIFHVSIWIYDGEGICLTLCTIRSALVQKFSIQKHKANTFPFCYLFASVYLQQFCSRLIFIAKQKATRKPLFFLSLKYKAKKNVVHYFPRSRNTNFKG